MRLAFRTNLHQLPLCAALCAIAGLLSVPQVAAAQDSVPVTPAANAAFVTVTDTSSAVNVPAPASADTTTQATASGDPAKANLTPDASSFSDVSLDDQVLSRQRGGFSGMLMVAATPQLMRGANSGGNGVTLWDEIAPPSPMPIPLDAAANAQGNVAAYQRK
ncbi:hypothetical protein [Paraburkholderia sp. DHOC27]|uniref:hypothetical protein n=1 Tax=Paraburkholderia sp. DHOC27 TaxID=2303330 RepID=UPI000E3E2DFD|nr:hypothetical protein [Paraburkholderia sp. DHOC27]RFU46730.1 hypothetical protein D0B32_17160 [Paraburkholderia sp. DHOC27]